MAGAVAAKHLPQQLSVDRPTGFLAGLCQLDEASSVPGRLPGWLRCLGGASASQVDDRFRNTELVEVGKRRRICRRAAGPGATIGMVSPEDRRLARLLDSEWTFGRCLGQRREHSVTAIQQRIDGLHQFCLHRGFLAELVQIVDDQQGRSAILGAEIGERVGFQGVGSRGQNPLR